MSPGCERVNRIKPTVKSVIRACLLFWSVFDWQFLMTCNFSVSLKFGSCYITGLLHQICCCCFSSQNLRFHHFYFFFFSFFWQNIKLRQQNINQSETRTGDKKLSLDCISVIILLPLVISFWLIGPTSVYKKESLLIKRDKPELYKNISSVSSFLFDMIWYE